MISKFFSTSKPIHFVIVLVYVLILFVISKIELLGDSISNVSFFIELCFFLVILGSVFVLDFLVRKNRLTQKNSYKILIFALLLGLFQSIFHNNNILIANFFILLALRRLLSVRSRISIKKKMFDAAFWIGIASLFYFWAILFFVLTIFTLLLYSIAQIKNWIIPFSGIVCVGVLMLTYTFIQTNDFDILINYIQSISIDFSVFNNINYIIAMTVVASLGLWSSGFFIKNLKDKTRGDRPSFILILIAMFIGVVIIFIAPDKNGSEFIFGFAPLAIVISNYLETIKERWFTEIFIWLLMLTPLTYLIFK